MEDAQRLSDFTQVPLCSSGIRHHTHPRDYFQIRDLGKGGQNIILHAVREKLVLFTVAEVLKGQNSNTSFRNRFRQRVVSWRSSIFRVPLTQPRNDGDKNQRENSKGDQRQDQS